MEEKKYGEKAIEEAKLETWENPSQENDYIVDIEFPEFTCLCPHSGSGQVYSGAQIPQTLSEFISQQAHYS